MADTAIKDLSLSSFGEISYAGYSFGSIRQAKVDDTPVHDPSGRKIVKIRRRLSVHSYIFSDSISGEQASMDNMRAALERNGQALRLKDIGFGTEIDTSNPSKHVDIGVGVQVISLAMIPAGGEFCYEIFWVAEYDAPPTCLNGAPVPGAFVAYTYSIGYSVNGEGLVTRRLAGECQVYIPPGSNYNIEYTFNRLYFTLPIIMRRDSFERVIQPNGTTITFSCIDYEQDNEAWPDGLIDCDAEEDFENRPPGFINWSASLSCTVKVAKGYNKALGAVKFFALLADRISKLNGMVSASTKGVIIPEKIRMSSKIFGRESRFYVAFRLVACIHDILSGSLWKPVSGTSYASWAASMAAVGIGDPRGVSQLTYNSNDRVVLDICDPIATSGRISLGNDTFRQNNPTQQASGLFNCAGITEERSYLLYENELHAMTMENAKIHRISQQQSGTVPFTQDGQWLGIGQPKTQVEKDHVVQYQSAPDAFILLVGKAMRLKYAPMPPKLTKLGGVEVEHLETVTKILPMTGFFHCTLFSGQWSSLYRAKGYVSSLKPPANDVICFTEGEK